MLIVKKFGGTSVANKERIFNVAKRCIEDYQKGNDVVVVLSAMGKYTDELIEKAKEVAKENGYQGIHTVGQDNNLAACKFYIKSGFVIGGLDTKVYQGTKQEGKKDILFYLDI